MSSQRAYTSTAKPSPKSEHVGSFLRPKEVLEARKANQDGSLSDKDLREVEDKNIAQLVKSQLSNGIKSISGEYRREYFHFDFLKKLGGIELRKEELAQHDAANKPTRLVLHVTGKVHHAHDIEVDNFKFLQEQVRGQNDSVRVKMTIPSPTMCHFRGGRKAISEEVYPDLDQFFEDLAQAYREEIAALAAAGCKYLQMDDTNLAYLCDVKMREQAAGRGEDLNTLPRRYAQLINAALKDKPEDMTVALHLCRGNFKSTHFAEGGYEPVAEVLFNDLNVDTYLLEFDTDRSGNFEPLRFLPKGHKQVVLGIVSTKVATLEDKQAMVKRIREAAKYAPLEQLAVGPQCGFSSTHHGNDISFEDQWAKLRLCQEIAEEVWGKNA